MSIKRNVIMDDYAGEITELYNVPVTTTNVPLG
jgi:long-chain acyl-CoA synthetase